MTDIYAVCITWAVIAVVGVAVGTGWTVGMLSYSQIKLLAVNGNFGMPLV